MLVMTRSTLPTGISWPVPHGFGYIHAIGLYAVLVELVDYLADSAADVESLATLVVGFQRVLVFAVERGIPAREEFGIDIVVFVV